MDWHDRLIDSGADGAGESLAERVDRLYQDQLQSWPGLRDGVAALQRVKLRHLEIDGAEVVLQHNPGRIVSTSARVDAASIQRRACFLCAANMPPEEKGIAFDERLGLFCNPFPVLEKHLVIIAGDHVEQRLSGNIVELLRLARDLGPGYAVIYNGPASGASAPDHLHFQAGVASALPLVPILQRHALRVAPTEVGSLRAYGAGFAILFDDVLDRLAARIEILLQTLGDFAGVGTGEPMLNALVYFVGGTWHVAFIPRQVHRPKAYFAEGPARLVISPATIDIAGLLVVPREEDFLRLDAEVVASIYSEVTYSAERLTQYLSLV